MTLINKKQIEELQVAVYLIEQFHYMFVKTDQQVEETWLCNQDHRTYPIIHISHRPINKLDEDAERLLHIEKAIGANINNRNRLLEIRICDDEAVEHPDMDVVVLNENGMSGTDVSAYFPDLDKQLSNITNIEETFMQLNKRIKAENARRASKPKSFSTLMKKPTCTRIIIAVCVALFAAMKLVSWGIGMNGTEVAIRFQAYYKIFIVAGEWWRLFTAGFLHIDVWHLMMNMMSMNAVGTSVEKLYGKKHMLIILCGGIIFGNLFMFAMADNKVGVGLSGGLYALLAVMLLQGYYAGMFALPSYQKQIGQLVLINLFINFMPGVGWLAHVGGAIFGFLYGFVCIRNTHWEEVKRNAIISLVVIFIAMVSKGYMNRQIREIYITTDMGVCETYRQIGLSGYADMMQKRLFNIYEGGY